MTNRKPTTSTNCREHQHLCQKYKLLTCQQWSCAGRILLPDLNGGSQDGELRGLPSGLVGLQHLLDEPLNLPFRHAVAVTRLAEDVDALRQLVVDTWLAHRRSHGSSRQLRRQLCQTPSCSVMVDSNTTVSPLIISKQQKQTHHPRIFDNATQLLLFLWVLLSDPWTIKPQTGPTFCRHHRQRRHNDGQHQNTDL